MQLDHDNNEQLPDFGWWPEIVGVILVASAIGFLLGLSDGIF